MTLYTGNTIEEAIERGLKRENLARENAHVEIEQRESKGFLGVGRKRARVNIEPIHEDTVRRADRLATRHVDTSDMEVPEAETAKEATLRLNKVVKAVRAAGIQEDDNLTEEEKQEKIEDIKEKTSREPVDLKEETSDFLTEIEAEIKEKVVDYLVLITQQMGISVTINIEKKEEVLCFNMSSQQDALLIGKHGKILGSLEIVAKAYANTITNERVAIQLNVGNYHEKRTSYLTSLAKRAAERARSGETVYINNLPARERKIVHNVIAKEDGISSHSEGQNKHRYIVVTKNI